jgi:hypothetical protein
MDEYHLSIAESQYIPHCIPDYSPIKQVENDLEIEEIDFPDSELNPISSEIDIDKILQVI